MEILSGLHKTILRTVPALPDGSAFTFTGGTCLSAFFLRHRKSLDLDFFTGTEEILLPFSRRLEEALRAERMSVERTRGLHSFVELFATREEESVGIHLALDSPFRIGEPSDCPEFPGLRISGLEDLAADKLLALFGRAALRDFVDVYFLARERFTKAELSVMARRKDPGFDPYWLGVAMERVEDFPVDAPDMHLLLRPCSMDDLKTFFGAWRREIAGALLGR